MQVGELADGVRQRRQLIVAEVKRLQVGELADLGGEFRQAILSFMKPKVRLS